MKEGEQVDFEDTDSSSPWLRRVVWLVPLGLAIDILLSLWVSYRHVSHSVNIHAEAEWEPGERLAARAQIVDHAREGVERVRVKMELVDEAGAHFDLGELPSVPGGGLNQGSFEVPAKVTPGQATVTFNFDAQLGANDAVHIEESLPVAIVEDRSPRTPVHRVASSVLQWADDTQAQPKDLRIDAMPYGRLLAGFDNQILIRVTDPAGKGLERELAVRLVSGEFGDEVGPGEHEFKAGKQAPALFEGKSDAWGLVAFRGALNSDVVRLYVEVFEPEGERSDASNEAAGGAAPVKGAGEVKTPAASERKSVGRRFRLVSFSGGVRLELDRRKNDRSSSTFTARTVRGSTP
jgi:hypothetical protein